ncbi:unnamed protein product [Vitrella brassicaformis CCMP3155]|uniref:CCHC-type domain-containing protein n=1 Tax=Vitrella brassicaformis (strain CCMP3155) TaxID=1169540 RepID=A0A0G4GM48_VITBC|nr:unnamed protein product [Vitrella brassicaformis CCMP3155]|eukprot:CEM31257.1 unnamed protein product [Vitrella brassicaformis CCMP3155]
MSASWFGLSSGGTTRCRVPCCTFANCRRTGRHYCKWCKETDSDHFARDCRFAPRSTGADDGNESDDNPRASRSSRRASRSRGSTSAASTGSSQIMQPMMQQIAAQLLTSMMQPPPPPPAPATGAGQQDNTDQTADQNTNQQTNQNANAALAAPVCDPRVLAAAMLFSNLFLSGQQQQQGGDSPRHRGRSPSPRRQSCGLRGCREDHSTHKCRQCGKINSHMTKDCPQSRGSMRE